MARYEKHDGGEGKFWEITLKGLVVSTRIGKIGAGASRDRDGNLYLYDRRGRTTDRECDDPASAQRAYDKLVAAKLQEGYRLVEAVAAAAPTEIHINDDLEAAIIAAPDDDDAYLVYADWLIANGDPRGELVTTQHGMRALSDPARFMTFKKREEALRAAHLRSWLGDVAGAALHRLRLDWRNGFVRAIRIDRPDNPTEVGLTELVAAALASPIVRFVREISIRGTAGEVADAAPKRLPPVAKRIRLFMLARANPALVIDDRARVREERDRYLALGLLADVDTYTDAEYRE